MRQKYFNYWWDKIINNFINWWDKIINNFINWWDRIIRNILIIDETELLEIFQILMKHNYQKNYFLVLSGYEVPKSIIIIVLFGLKVTMSPDIIIFPS
jgi:hypothetical protein